MSKTKLLLVEDSKIILVELKKFLAATGLFDILVAENGIKALEELKKNFIPIIVTDLLMEEMDGFQLIEEIKKSDKIEKNKHIDQTVIVISSLDKKDDIRRAITLGAYDVLPKPIDKELFLSKIKNYYQLYKLMLESEGKFQKINNLNTEIMDSYENRLLESEELTKTINRQQIINTEQDNIINKIKTLAIGINEKRGHLITELCDKFKEFRNPGNELQ